MKKSLRKLYQLLDRKQKISFLLIFFIMIFSAGLAQVTPKAIGWLTDDILLQDHINFEKILPILLIILLASTLNQLIIILRRIMVEDTATKTEKKARSLVISSLLKTSLSYYKNNMIGNIHGRLNRCLEGTVNLEKLIFMDFAPAIFNSIAAIIIIFLTLPVYLALLTLLVIPIGLLIVFRQISTQKGIRIDLLETKAAMDGSIVELLNGIEVIRISDSNAIEEKRFRDKSEFLRNKEMKHHLQMAKYDSLKFFNEIFFTVLMIAVSTYLATQHVISVGAVLTSYLCFNQLIKPLEELHRILDELSESLILAEDFFKMAELPPDFSYVLASPAASAYSPSLALSPNISAQTSASPFADNRRRQGDSPQIPLLDISRLNFSYQEETVLEDINLSLPAGYFLGIAGPSGCGKSSLIKAICKLEKAQGTIHLDGRNLAQLSRQEISQLLALVPQNPFLFAGTIRENICYGLKEQPSSAQLASAIQKAQLSEFIDTLPDKLETVIAEHGGNLSGGQKQRIAIARVFLRNPKILVLDEATSALDNTTESQIQQEIEKLRTENKTTIISIAHRLTTLKNCDRIIVIDQGKITQSGQYHDLLEQEGIFNDMYHGKLK